MKIIQASAVLLACTLLAPLTASAENRTTRSYVDQSGYKMECWQEEVTTTEEKGGHKVLGTVAGGIIGGVAGHQIGGGRGKDAATVAGAVGGAVIGNKMQKNRTESNTVVEERCRRVD